jgi:hypothetical protein
MKDIERVSVVLLVLFLLAKFLFRFDVDVILFISFTFLAVYYYILGFFLLNDFTFKSIFKKSSYGKLSTMRILGSIGASIFLSSLLISILFIIMRYEGGLNQFLIGITSVVIVIIISLVKYQTKKDPFYMKVVLKFSLWAALGIVIYSIAK